MAESEVPVYATNEHFQGPDARNAEQARAEMVRLTLKPQTLKHHWACQQSLSGCMLLLIGGSGLAVTGLKSATRTHVLQCHVQQLALYHCQPPYFWQDQIMLSSLL